MSSSLQGFVMKRIWIHGDHKSKMKVWESPFIPSHLTFKRFWIHSLSVNQSHNNPTNSQIYLFIITFQNLEFWDVTNLPPLKCISSSRFGEAGKKRLGFGGLLKIPSIIPGVWGATTLRSMVTVPSKLIYSILILDSVGLSDRKDNSFSGLFR